MGEAHIDKRMFFGSLFAILLLSFLGLFLSGIFREPVTNGVIAIAIIGVFVIAMIVWIPLLYFIKKYQGKRKQ